MALTNSSSKGFRHRMMAAAGSSMATIPPAGIGLPIIENGGLIGRRGGSSHNAAHNSVACTRLPALVAGTGERTGGNIERFPRAKCGTSRSAWGSAFGGGRRRWDGRGRREAGDDAALRNGSVLAAMLIVHVAGVAADAALSLSFAKSRSCGDTIVFVMVPAVATRLLGGRNRVRRGRGEVTHE